jgi:hypothetical protein
VDQASANRCGILVLACMVLFVGQAKTAEGANPPLDGIVVSIRAEEGKKIEQIFCHTFRNGKTVSSTSVYQSEGRIVSACMSPFGNQVAFIKPGGTVAVVGLDGKDVRELVDDALYVQWPASDGGRWVYYLDAKTKSALRRVNVKTKEDQQVVVLDHVVDSIALSQDASPTSGWCLVGGGDSNRYAVLYPMDRGTGSTWAVPQWWTLMAETRINDCACRRMGQPSDCSVPMGRS